MKISDEFRVYNVNLKIMFPCGFSAKYLMIRDVNTYIHVINKYFYSAEKILSRLYFHIRNWFFVIKLPVFFLFSAALLYNVIFI